MRLVICYPVRPASIEECGRLAYIQSIESNGYAPLTDDPEQALVLADHAEAEATIALHAPYLASRVATWIERENPMVIALPAKVEVPIVDVPTQPDPDRQNKVNKLTSKALDDAVDSGRSLGWYVSEYYSNLSDADLDQEFRDAGLDAPASKHVWSSGWNIPGYLPDDEPMNFDTWEEARAALVEELLATSEQSAEHDVDEAALYDHVLAQLNQSEPDTNFCERAGNYVWWVQRIVLPDYDKDATVG